jgi:tetratricopeptide (TPR) repeat protein
MICPYCQTRNAPNIQVCTHCGAILRLQRPEVRKRKSDVSRAKIYRWLAVAIAALISAFAAHMLVVEASGKVRTIASIVGAVLGAGLIYLVSGARVIYYTRKYRSRYGRLLSRKKHVLTTAEEKFEKQLEAQEGGWKPRHNLAISHLLQDEVEKSFQGFQQAQKLGASDPEFYNNVGVALARKGNLVQSVELFQKAVSMNGHKGQPSTNLAHAYWQVHADQEQLLIERAICEVERAIKIDGEKPIHRNRLGLILDRAGRYDEAVEQFNKALELAAGLKAEQADAYNNLGIAFVHKNDLRTAASHFQQALRLDPGHGRALSNLGILRLLQGDSADALEALQSAAMLDTRSAPVRSNLGYGLCRDGNINEGLREFREAILRDPNLFDPYYNLGKIYLDEKIMENAERNLARAIQLNPQSWEVLVAMAVIRLEQNKLPQAIQFLEKADTLAPNQPLIISNLAVCRALYGDLSGAEKLLQKAAELDEKNGEIHAQLGWVYLLQESVSLCANELTLAIQSNGEVADYHYNFGLCQTNQGQYDGALTSFRRTLQIDPEYKRAHYHVGYVHAIEKRFDQALKEWEVADRLERGFADLYVNMGVVYYQKGSYDQSVTQFRRVIAISQDRMDDFSNLGLALAKHGTTLKAASRNREDAKYKESVEKSKMAVEMFDRAIAIEPDNAMLHSNRGLACFFAHMPEEAMVEWATVTRLDPAYARRRGKAQQTEFDDSAIKFATMNILDRAAQVPTRTADFTFSLSPGYDTEDWAVMIEDEQMKEVPELNREAWEVERKLQSLRVG